MSYARRHSTNVCPGNRVRYRHTFAASPWAYDDKVFFLSEEGATVVVAAGPEYREMGTNALNEMSLATPAVSGDSLFIRIIRTATKLYRIRQTTGTNGR